VADKAAVEDESDMDSGAAAPPHAPKPTSAQPSKAPSSQRFIRETSLFLLVSAYFSLFLQQPAQ
jgi:hypothetical protein